MRTVDSVALIKKVIREASFKPWFNIGKISKATEGAKISSQDVTQKRNLFRRCYTRKKALQKMLHKKESSSEDVTQERKLSLKAKANSKLQNT